MKVHLCVVMVSLFCALTGLGQTVAFVGVNVIPMDHERVFANQTVVVRDGRIADIGDARKVKVPSDAVRVDGRGKYLMPGLVDMHTHLMSDSDMPDSIAEDELRVMVAQGVTTIRLMIGTPEQLLLRERSARGEIVAPTIYSASPHLTGREQGNNFVVAPRPTKAREAVRKSKQAGYDSHQDHNFHKARSLRSGGRRGCKDRHPRSRTRRQPVRRRRACVEGKTADRAPRRLYGDAAC